MFQWKFNAKLASMTSTPPIFRLVGPRGPWRSPFGRSAVGFRQRQSTRSGSQISSGATRERRAYARHRHRVIVAALTDAVTLSVSRFLANRLMRSLHQSVSFWRKRLISDGLMRLVISENHQSPKPSKRCQAARSFNLYFGHLFELVPPDGSRGPRRPTYRSGICAAMRIETSLLVESGTFCIQSAVHSVSTGCIHRHRSLNFESAL
jgi:hypothetical protein